MDTSLGKMDKTFKLRQTGRNLRTGPCMEETVWCSWIIPEKEQHCVTSFVVQLDDPTGALELLIEVLHNVACHLPTKGFLSTKDPLV